MREVLRVAAMAAIGLALLSCARRAEDQAAPPPVAYNSSGAPDGQAGYPEGDGQSLAAPYGRSDYPGAGTQPPPPPYDRSTYDAAEPEPPGGPYGQPSYAPSAPPPPSFYARPSYGRSIPPSYGRPSYAQTPQVITPPVYAPPRPTSYDRSAYAETAPPPPPNNMVWRSSPRWATVKKMPTRATTPAPQQRASTTARAKPVKPDPQAKFKAAQAKAAKVGVENLTQADIAGLSVDEIKRLRGY
jgi:hypothetical protein